MHLQTHADEWHLLDELVPGESVKFPVNKVQ